MLIDHRRHPFARLLLTPFSLFSTRETVDFPTPLKRAMSLMVSRFGMQHS